MKTAVLLINLGTPQSPKTKDVRRYLREFLNDPRVIDLPWLARKLLVNLIIVPFRSPKSAALYKELWTPAGSPLWINTKRLADAVQKELPDSFEIEWAMRYGTPALKDRLDALEQMQVERLILVPLYPQYASSTTGSTLQMANQIISKWKQIPQLSVLHHFHDHPAFIAAFSSRIAKYKPQAYDHIVLSYHGLPTNQVTESHGGKDCEAMGCATQRNEQNSYCYLASCYETSRLLALKMGWKPEDYTVCFQSRLSKNWITPFTDDCVKQLAAEGKKKLLVISPAFVGDCLETIHELGSELKKDFEKNSGGQLTLVESLNDQPQWVEALAGMIRKMADTVV